MKNQRFESLLEASARRALSGEERCELDALLAEHPERAAQFAEEEAFNRLLRELPSVPLSSNFTAQILESVQKEGELNRSPQAIGDWFSTILYSWRSPVRFASLFLLLAFLGWNGWEWRQSQLRVHYAESLSLVSEELDWITALRPADDVQLSKSFPTPEGLTEAMNLLSDFESISRIHPLPAQQDGDLLAALAY